MGKELGIRDKAGTTLGYLQHNRSCLIYTERLGKKYNPQSILHKYDSSHDINDVIEAVSETFKDAEPEDSLVGRIFSCDGFRLTEEHIPLLKKAIDKFPDDFNQYPKGILETYLGFLEKHKEISHVLEE